MKFIQTCRAAAVLLITVASLSLGEPGHAQPDINAVSQGQALAEEAQKRALAREWAALREEVGAQEVTDTKKAIERYQAFFDARGSKDTDVAVSIQSAIARLYWIELRDKPKALEIYDWTIQKYAAFPAALELVHKDRAALLTSDTNAVPLPATVGDAGTPPKLEAGGMPSPVRIDGAKAADPLAPVTITVGPEQPAPAPPPQTGNSLTTPGLPRAVVLERLLERLNGGTVSAAAASANGFLTVQEAPELLARMGDADPQPHRDLAGFIVTQSPEQLREPRKLPLKARLWLGDILLVLNDDRAPQLLESVLSDLPAPVSGFSSQWLLFNSIERLAVFHQGRKQHEKEAQAWLRLAPLLNEPNWMAPASALSAALAYVAGGQEAKAREACTKVPLYGVAWFSRLAQLDKTRAVLMAAQLIQSHAFLEQAAPGEARMNALALLAHAQNLIGDRKAAEAVADRALKYLQTLPVAQQGKVKDAEALARQTLSGPGKQPAAPR